MSPSLSDHNLQATSDMAASATDAPSLASEQVADQSAPPAIYEEPKADPREYFLFVMPIALFILLIVLAAVLAA
jgi:hypothetical protein